MICLSVKLFFTLFVNLNMMWTKFAQIKREKNVVWFETLSNFRNDSRNFSVSKTKIPEIPQRLKTKLHFS